MALEYYYKWLNWLLLAKKKKKNLKYKMILKE